VFERYGKIYLVHAQTDGWSMKKAVDHFRNMGIELGQQQNVEIIEIYRAREVKQSYITSIFTTIYAAFNALWIMTKIAANQKTGLDVLMTNGPGTALPLCYAHMFVNKILLFNWNAKFLFVESFCRVQELSLTGKLLLPLKKVMPGSRFIVQWEEL
jgi:beta-1,4-N-acetylglucosaminyltransferase